MKNKPYKLPKTLLGESPTIKFLYIYLSRDGWVKYSYTQLEDATGLSSPVLSRAFKRLRELGAIEYRGEQRRRVNVPYRIKL